MRPNKEGSKLKLLYGVLFWNGDFKLWGLVKYSVSKENMIGRKNCLRSNMA